MFSAIQFLKNFGKLPYLVKFKIFGNTIFYLERFSVSVSQRSTGRPGEKSLSFILCWHPDMMATGIANHARGNHSLGTRVCYTTGTVCLP